MAVSAKDRMKAYRRRQGLHPRTIHPGICLSCGKTVEAKQKLAKGRCMTCYMREVYYPRMQRKIRAYRNARRAHIKLATPAWADMVEIDGFYLNVPEGMEVDHIIPLRGNTISGLHVIGNLQYLTSSENKLKGNRFFAGDSLTTA